MNRIRKTLITGLLLLGVASVQASPFSAPQNNSLTTTLLKNNVIVSSVIGLSALLCAAYGIYKVFFRNKPVAMSKLTIEEQQKANGWETIHSYKSELEPLESIQQFAEHYKAQILLNALRDFGTDIENTGTQKEKAFLKWITGMSPNYQGLKRAYEWAYDNNRIDTMQQIASEIIGDLKEQIIRRTTQQS